MGSASALPSLWQVLPHGVTRAAALVSEVEKPPDLEERAKASDKPESQREWRPFGRHVRREDVVSTAPPSYLPSWFQAELRQAHRINLPPSGSLGVSQVVQLRWHGQNDVLMWSFLLLVLLAAAIRHLLLTASSQQQSSLQLMGSALCWLCVSAAAVLINW